jgi:SAM-dependent methyltransferase
VDTDYGERYRDLYDHHWWWRARERFIIEALLAHRPPGGFRSILDVGCGDGLFFYALGNIDGVQLVEGVESVGTLVSSDGEHRNRIHIAPFDDHFDLGRRYSAVLLLDVLEHLAEPETALRHALALLEPGGVVLTTVPAFMTLWTRHDDLNHHFTRFTRNRFAKLATAVNMRVDESRYFFHWTVAAKLATRLTEALMPGPPRVPTVPPAMINRFLFRLSLLEERLTTGLRLPFGTSLLVIGGRGEASGRPAGP